MAIEATGGPQYDLFDLPNQTAELLKKKATSIGCIVEKNKLELTKGSSTTYRITESVQRSMEHIRIQTTNNSEPTQIEHLIGEKGTVFLIAPEMVIMPKLNNEKIVTKCFDNFYIVFNFYKKSRLSEDNFQFPEKDVYAIKSIIDTESSKNNNYCALLLSKPSEDPPLEISIDPLQVNENLYMLGHSDGGFLKYAPKATMKRFGKESNIFDCKTSADEMGLGSLLFRETSGRVVGYYSQGELSEDDESNSDDSLNIQCQGFSTIPIAQNYQNFRITYQSFNPQVHGKGLNVEFKCTTKECTSFDRSVWKNYGMKQSSIEELMVVPKCDECPKHHRNGGFGVKSLALYNCDYELWGILSLPKKQFFEEKGSLKKMKSVVLTIKNDDTAYAWTTLRIEPKE